MPLRYGLIEPAEIPSPRLPRALEGLRLAHVSDLHVRGPGRVYTRLITQLTSMRADLVLFTGDAMDEPGDEDAAMGVMDKLLQRLRPRIGCFGIFGNHDTPTFRKRAADLPIHWLDGQVYDDPERPLRIMGVAGASEWDADCVHTALNVDRWDHQTDPGEAEAQQPPNQQTQRPLHLMLCHWPNRIAVAAEMDIDLMLSGHSHGGQFRLPTGQVLYNGTKELPRSMTSGLLRCRNTLGVTSRGLGNSNIDLRLFCPPHVPFYTLRCRSAPGHGDERIERLWAW